MAQSSMFGVNVSLDEHGFDDMVHALGLTEARVYAAGYRAVRKTALWVKTHSARVLSKELKIVQKIIRQRLRIYMQDKKSLKAKVWMGMYQVRASRLGRARQTRAGVSVGRHRFPGAFVATLRSGHDDVFQRRGKTRLPIDVVQLDISEQAERALEDITEKADTRLLQIMQQEINFELKKMNRHVN